MFEDYVFETPIDVTHIIYKYFSHNEIFLIYLPSQNQTPVCVKVRNNYYSQHKMRIYELNPPDIENDWRHNNFGRSNGLQSSTEFGDSLWRIQGSSLCMKQSIKLPKIVTNKINTAYNKFYRFDTHSKEGQKNYYKYDSDTYTIIFNRGLGHRHETSSVWDKKCYAMVFNDREMYKSDTSSIIGFKYSLPTCKRELSQLLYSDRYGLIAVGGGISIYNLSFRNRDFHSQNKKQWKWLSFGHLQARRKDFSCVMLDAKRLMVVGGDSRPRFANSELIDLSGHRNERTKVTECAISRNKCGIMYDNYNKRTFVGGGKYVGDAMDEFYDLEKDKWICYARSGQNQLYDSFKDWPNLYSADYQVIYMTNNKAEIRMIDLRENKQKWKSYRPNVLLQAPFGVRVVSYR